MMNFFATIARPSLLAVFAAATAASAAPALAAEEGVAPRAALSVTGVDFTSPQAVAHVKHQLRRVAMDMCWVDPSRNIMMNADERACYTTAVHDGLTQIDSRAQQAMRDRDVMVADSNPAR